MWQELNSPGNRGAELTLILLQHLALKIFHHSAQWVLSYQEDGQCHYRVWYLSKGVTAGSHWRSWTMSPVVKRARTALGDASELLALLSMLTPPLSLQMTLLLENLTGEGIPHSYWVQCAPPPERCLASLLFAFAFRNLIGKKIRQTLVLRLPVKKATEFWLYGCGRGTTDWLAVGNFCLKREAGLKEAMRVGLDGLSQFLRSYVCMFEDGAIPSKVTKQYQWLLKLGGRLQTAAILLSISCITPEMQTL